MPVSNFAYAASKWGVDIAEILALEVTYVTARVMSTYEYLSDLAVCFPQSWN
jgi:hypothetical protein